MCLSSSPSFRGRSLSDLAASDSLSRVVFDSLIGFRKEAKGRSELSEQSYYLMARGLAEAGGELRCDQGEWPAEASVRIDEAG